MNCVFFLSFLLFVCLFLFCFVLLCLFGWLVVAFLLLLLFSFFGCLFCVVVVLGGMFVDCVCVYVFSVG